MSEQTHQRRTLDGYQVPVPRPDAPPPRNPNLKRTVKTAGHGGTGNQHQPNIAGGGVANVATGVGAGPGRISAGARPAGRFDASSRPQPIRSASTLSGPLAFPPPIPRRDLMRFQRQAQQAERVSRKSIASSVSLGAFGPRRVFTQHYGSQLVSCGLMSTRDVSSCLLSRLDNSYMVSDTLQSMACSRPLRRSKDASKATGNHHIPPSPPLPTCYPTRQAVDTSLSSKSWRKSA